jgi:hypothetical protein
MRFTKCVPALLCALFLSGAAQAQGIYYVTQHRINEMAAVLDRARVALLEDTGLRQDGETLPGYLHRIAAPLPGEKPPAYRTRLEGCLNALAQATDATAPIRRIPTLQEAGEANRLLWQKIARSVGYLPRRMVKLHAAWKETLSKPNAASCSALGTEMTLTLTLMIVALNDLRDARP